jgi:hypothetical protein
MRVEQHPWEALFEPLAAPFMILAGAPDFRPACTSVLIWVVLGAAAWGMIYEFRVQKRKKPFVILFKGIQGAFVASSTLLLIVCLFVVGRIPCWRLVVDDPDLIVADLHSHTTKSHDAVVSLKTNLEWHASCGYNLVALTEHDQLFDHETQSQGDSSFDRLPAFISGVEAHTGFGGVVLGLCRDSHVQMEKFILDEAPDRTAWFSRKIHEECGGAVIALTLKRLAPGAIARLADDGVDGFELVNSGHPEMRPDLRQEVLDVCRSRGLALVASTDWHGWTGLAKTWTVIKAPGSSALSPRQRADLVLDKLLEHNSADVIPVVAGYIGDPSLARAVFSPVVETVRYARELSAARVISWWLWVWAVFVLWAYLRKTGVRSGSVLLAAVVSATSLGLIFSGISLVGEGTGSAASYPTHIGFVSIAIGVAVFGYSTIGGIRLLRRRRNQSRECDE